MKRDVAAGKRWRKEAGEREKGDRRGDQGVQISDEVEPADVGVNALLETLLKSATNETPSLTVLPPQKSRF